MHVFYPGFAEPHFSNTNLHLLQLFLSPHQHHQLLSPIAQTMGRKKLTPGKFSHLPKSERPKMRDSKAVKDAKARKPEGPPSKKQKGGMGEANGKVLAGSQVKVKTVQASQVNIVPFDVHDEILCVGEGLFSTHTYRRERCKGLDS
jgi:hypothetical protein